jgi:hypothetical protein
MAKCIQVSALQKRLFALDEEGDISQHHVNAKT